MDKKKAVAIILVLLAVALAIIYGLYQLKQKKTAGPEITPKTEEAIELNKTDNQQEANDAKNIEAVRQLLEQTAKEIAASSTLQKEMEKNKIETKKLLDETAKIIAASSTLQAEMDKNAEATKKLLQNTK